MPHITATLGVSYNGISHDLATAVAREAYQAATRELTAQGASPAAIQEGAQAAAQAAVREEERSRELVLARAAARGAAAEGSPEIALAQSQEEDAAAAESVRVLAGFPLQEPYVPDRLSFYLANHLYIVYDPYNMALRGYIDPATDLPYRLNQPLLGNIRRALEHYARYHGNDWEIRPNFFASPAREFFIEFLNRHHPN